MRLTTGIDFAQKEEEAQRKVIVSIYRFHSTFLYRFRYRFQERCKGSKTGTINGNDNGNGIWKR